MISDGQCKFLFVGLIADIWRCFRSKETHQLAQANDEKNRRLREAFGIGEFNQKEALKRKAEEAKEAERRKAELANKNYA